MLAGDENEFAVDALGNEIHGNIPARRSRGLLNASKSAPPRIILLF